MWCYLIQVHGFRIGKLPELSKKRNIFFWKENEYVFYMKYPYLFI